VSLFRLFQLILHDSTIQKNKNFEELLTLIKKLVRDFIQLCLDNQDACLMAFVWKRKSDVILLQTGPLSGGHEAPSSKKKKTKRQRYAAVSIDLTWCLGRAHDCRSLGQNKKTKNFESILRGDTPGLQV
jgi:hypothetical protein